MAEEEFEESDILFRDVEGGLDHGDFPASSDSIKLLIKECSSSSCPIDIPGSRNVSENRMFGSDACGGGKEEFAPPHVVIGRRVGEKLMAFSICTGKGRTLKGRDLTEFRNKIFRMTGFLEA